MTVEQAYDKVTEPSYILGLVKKGFNFEERARIMFNIMQLAIVGEGRKPASTPIIEAQKEWSKQWEANPVNPEQYTGGVNEG